GRGGGGPAHHGSRVRRRPALPGDGVRRRVLLLHGARGPRRRALRRRPGPDPAALRRTPAGRRPGGPDHPDRPRARGGDGMKPVMRRTRAAVVAGAALVLAASCTSGSTDAGAANAGAKGPVIRIAVGVDPSYAPLYLAMERGMFAKAGVNVQLM